MKDFLHGAYLFISMIILFILLFVGIMLLPCLLPVNAFYTVKKWMVK